MATHTNTKCATVLLLFLGLLACFGAAEPPQLKDRLLDAATSSPWGWGAFFPTISQNQFFTTVFQKQLFISQPPANLQHPTMALLRDVDSLCAKFEHSPILSKAFVVRNQAYLCSCVCVCVYVCVCMCVCVCVCVCVCMCVLSLCFSSVFIHLTIRSRFAFLSPSPQKTNHAQPKCMCSSRPKESPTARPPVL